MILITIKLPTTVNVNLTLIPFRARLIKSSFRRDAILEYDYQVYRFDTLLPRHTRFLTNEIYRVVNNR